ncbi:hypothetical protein [Hyphomonas sp.]|uniref:hypothetical protein n=1 Tax=Hyphomonas sp. TaxID=87 RepID=UPI00391DDE49
MIRTTLISAAAIAAAALSAHAGEKPLFADIDTNFDGVITQDEFLAYAVESGKHTAEEAAEKFEKMAGDDGVITLEEWTEAMIKYDERQAEGSSDY